MSSYVAESMQASHRVGVDALRSCREISGYPAGHVWPRRNECRRNTTAGVDSTPAVSDWSTSFSQRQVGEVDEAGAASVYQRHVVAEPPRARLPIGGEGFMVVGLQHFADRVVAGRQPGEDIVP